MYDEELFDTINEIHEQTGHGARDVMNTRVKKKYANVTKEVRICLLRDFSHPGAIFLLYQGHPKCFDKPMIRHISP